MAQEQAPRRVGWYRSPGGVLAHADGPSQVRAFSDRGYTEVPDDDAVKEIGDGITLIVDSAVAGTFDADAVHAAVKDEGQAAARSAAARKAAATRRANRAAAEKAGRDAANVESDAVTPEG